MRGSGKGSPRTPILRALLGKEPIEEGRGLILGVVGADADVVNPYALDQVFDGVYVVGDGGLEAAAEEGGKSVGTDDAAALGEQDATLRPSCCGRGRKKARALAWVMATGRSECSMASRVVRSPTWERSMRMPRRFISRTASRPKWLRPSSERS